MKYLYNFKISTGILFFLVIGLNAIPVFGQVQNLINYELSHNKNEQFVTVTIDFDSRLAKNTKLVIPRSGPGTYDLTNYAAFVTNVIGYSADSKNIKGILGSGSYFEFDTLDSIKKISYDVDIKKMESELLGGFASSKLREGYLGILGYSVFGFVESLEYQPIHLTIKTDSSVPIFSTLRPSTDRNYGNETYEIQNFSLLADAQYLLGNRVQLYQISEATIPLFVAVYSETEIDIEEIGRRVSLSLNGLIDYFGYLPMPHYTACYEFLKPYSNKHDYGFSMEHLNSLTSSFSLDSAITKYEENARIGGIVHHIGHSWIPLRSYGEGYRPFEWQTAPLIETIWLNEGFTWYVSFYKVLNIETIINRFQNTLNEAPNYIKEKSLKELSLLGSTQYSLDFRIGKNLFSRGALMAYELDLEIINKTNGEKSFKDIMLGFLKWTELNKRPFGYEEILPIMEAATGVDLFEIWNKWQGPIRN